MLIKYGCELSIVVNQPTPMFCLVDIHPDRRSDIIEETALAASTAIQLSDERDAFGNRLRRFTAPPGETALSLHGVIADSGVPEPRDLSARALSIAELPVNVLTHLNGSRYCETDRLGHIAWSSFGHLPRNGALVQAICDFVNGHIRFDYQCARCTRTALEAYEEREGVCRDFAHLAIALCRSMNIPARYVNGYLGDIAVPFNPAPMDFNAWFEVYLDGTWHTYDARHNERRIGRIPIARGRDACDVPMLQTFGPHFLKTFSVITEVLGCSDRWNASPDRSFNNERGDGHGPDLFTFRARVPHRPPCGRGVCMVGFCRDVGVLGELRGVSGKPAMGRQAMASPYGRWRN
jgi:transglutaminase-like putative cysteine protease